MKFGALMKALPAIMRGRAIVITFNKRNVRADCGKLSDKTVQYIAEGLLASTTQTKR